MKNILLPLLAICMVACNSTQNNSANKPEFNVHYKKPDPVTAVSQIEAVSLKDYSNREINYVYKIYVDSSSNREILLKKMYQLQRKLRVPFARPLNSPEANSYSFVLENDVSIFDNLSQTIIEVKEINPLSVFVIGNNACLLPRMPNNFINLDYFYFSCPLDTTQSANKSIAMIIESFQSKQKADSMLTLVKTVAKNAHLIKQRENNLYVNN